MSDTNSATSSINPSSSPAARAAEFVKEDAEYRLARLHALFVGIFREAEYFFDTLPPTIPFLADLEPIINLAAIGLDLSSEALQWARGEAQD